MAQSNSMNVDDVCRLMESMASTKMGSLEWGDLKLQAALPERVVVNSSAASGIMAPRATPAPPAEVTPETAAKAVQEARIEARRQADLKLALAQQKTAAARTKAAGGIGMGTSKLVADVYKDAVQTPAPKKDSNV